MRRSDVRTAGHVARFPQNGRDFRWNPMLIWRESLALSSMMHAAA